LGLLLQPFAALLRALAGVLVDGGAVQGGVVAPEAEQAHQAQHGHAQPR
jgi:hypothetical protein